MNPKNSLLFFMLFFSGSALFAQQLKVTGKVINSSNYPIEFANVFIQNQSNNSIQTGSITSNDGTFEMRLSQEGDYSISISFIGYEDWNKNVTLLESTDLGNILLQESTNELEEIVVTAKADIIKRVEDKLVFNVANSPLKTGYDGIEVLRRTPYIVVNAEGGITMRNENPTVLINGRISNLSGTELTNFLSNLNSDNIKSIEIQTHLSANTDAESSGGVINIVLKKKPVGINGTIRSDYTFKGAGFKNAFGGINFNYGEQKWNIYGSSNYVFNSSESKINQTFDYHELESEITSEEAYTSEYGRSNYQLGFVADIANKHIIGIEGFATDYGHAFENNGLVNSYEQGLLLENGKSFATGDNDYLLYNLTMNYSWKLDTLNSNLKFFADIAQQDITRKNSSSSTYFQGIYSDLTERNIAPAKTLIYSSQVDFEKYLPLQLKWEAGLKYTFTDRLNTLFSDILTNGAWNPTSRTNSFNYNEKVTAAYTSLSRSFADKYFVKIGLRAENTDLQRLDLKDNSSIKQDYINYFPSVYISRDLKNNQSLSFSYSKRLRRPPFRFLNNNAIKINDFRYELGNPDLIPERVNNWEISYKSQVQGIDLYFQRTNEAINGIYYLEGQIAYYQKFNEGIQQQFGISYNRFGNLFKWWHVQGRVDIYHRKFINHLGNDSFERTTANFYLSNNFKINETTSIDLIAAYNSPYEDAYYIEFENYYLNLMFQKQFFKNKITCRIYVKDPFNWLLFRSERPFETFRSEREDKWRSRQLRFWVSYNFNGKHQVNKRKNKSKNDARRRL